MERAVERGLSAFSPPPKLSICEWAEEHARLSRESSAEPGQYRADRAPYQRGILDAICDPHIERVVIEAGAQVGKTLIELLTIGYYSDQDPSPIIWMQPTLDMAEAVSKDRLAPFIRDTPRLTGIFADPKARDSGSTLLHKQFTGGHITLVGANSPASLASRPIRIVLLDEVDRYPISAGAEGDPITLVVKRATTFWNRKIVIASTPTDTTSRIDRLYGESDQRVYEVPCPDCETYQRILFAQVKFPKAKDGQPFRGPVEYLCKECGVLIPEAKRVHMLRKGRWRITQPGNGDGKTAGFHLSSLYSPWQRWTETVQKFLEAKTTPETLRVFVNTELGEIWQESRDAIKIGRVLERREVYAAAAPAGVLVITNGCDVQNDRIEASRWGWGKNQEGWLLEHRVFRGKPSLPAVWEELDAWLREPVEHELGITLRSIASFIDSGGLSTAQVYRFTQAREARWICAVKGKGGVGIPVTGRPSRVGVRKTLLFTIGVDQAKENLMGRLRVENPGPAYLHFPQADWCDEEYFKQLTAEHQVRQRIGHIERLIWKKRRDGMNNEALDCAVYAMAALDARRVDFDAVEKAMMGAVQRFTKPPEPKKLMPRPSNWMTGWKR
jgi:phage terminase large subunit GpA-like protein